MAVVLLLSFCLDFANVRAGGSIDLRNRITGARLLADHRDPYFYKWHEPEPAEFCDPYNNPLLPVSKTTATPAALVLNLPLALLPYRAGQWIWFLAQWLLLLGTVALWWPRCAPGWPRALLVAFAAGFTYTAAWRLHAERGQSYVLLLFLFAAWLAATLHEKGSNRFWTGLLAGFLMTLRPPFLLLAPFLIWQRRGQLAGAGVGLLLGIALPMVWGFSCWKDYHAAMDVHAWLYRSGIDPTPPPERFPPEIEGMSTDLLGNYATLPYADFSIHALLRGFGWEPVPAWPPLLIVASTYGAWLWWARRLTMERQLLGLAVGFFLIDLFLPAYRNNYNDVLVLNIVALGLIVSGLRPPGQRGVRATQNGGLIACFLALPAGWAIAWFAPMHDWMIDIPSFLLTLGAVLMLFLFNSGPGPRKV
jgi:hypothetical protein